VTERFSSRADPPHDCDLCARLSAFRDANRAAEPEWHNAPVATFGSPRARLLVVGLAPGLKGANRTGRPFTGDYAGDLLYETLSKFGFSRGRYDRRPDDGLELVDASITNAVRCVPPQNKPVGAEMRACRPFLATTVAEHTGLEAVLALGRIAHDNVLSTLELPRSAYTFAHNASHDLGRFRLFDSYHCSRYNTNTGRLTPEMFEAVFRNIRVHLDAD